MEARLALLAVPAPERPFGLAPVIRLRRAHHLGQIHAGQPRKTARRGNGRLRIERTAFGRGHDAARLRALFSQHPGEPAGVDPGNGDNVLGAKKSVESLIHTEVGRQKRQIADHEAGGMHAGRFDVLAVDTSVTDMRIGQRDDLARVTRVSQDFLITRHRGIEHHFADRSANRADALAVNTVPSASARRAGRDAVTKTPEFSLKSGLSKIAAPTACKKRDEPVSAVRCQLAQFYFFRPQGNVGSPLK